MSYTAPTPSGARCPITSSRSAARSGFASNGAISNLAPFPAGGVVAPRREVRQGDFDVIHVHEPVVPLVGWNATLGARTPVVGTFHAYSTKAIPNHIATAFGARRVFNRLSARIAVSEAAAWTGRRWYGGDYEIVPNGVDVDCRPERPEAGERGAAGAVRRPPRGAQGPAGPARSVRRPGRARALPPYRGRRRARGCPPLPARPRADALDRRRRAGLRRGAVALPARGRRALRAVALGRELRHGPHRGLRRRHAGDRLRDRRLQRRGDRRRRRGPRPARRPPAPRRGAAARPPRARAPAGDGRGGPAQRPALRLAASRRPGDGGLRAGDRDSPAAGRRRARRAVGRHPPCRRRAAAPAGAPALARPRPGAAGEQAAPGRPPGRAGRGRRAWDRADGAGGAEDRHRQRGRKHRPLQPHPGAGGLWADGALALRPRCRLVLDRASGPAATGRSVAATSPRRR